jgi:hypothetical protein
MSAVVFIDRLEGRSKLDPIRREWGIVGTHQRLLLAG